MQNILSKYWKKRYRTYPNYFQEVLDHDTWIFNLTEANQSPDSPLKWFKEYSFKELYELEDLSPDALNDMVTDKWMKQNSLLTKVSDMY